MLGKCYKAWCTGAEEAMKSSCKIATVLSDASTELHYNEVTFIQRYCDNNWTGQKMSISADGPHLLIIQVASDVYPVEAANIKRTSWSNRSPPLYTQITVHSPPSPQANWGGRQRPKRVGPSSCSSVFEKPWT